MVVRSAPPEASTKTLQMDGVKVQIVEKSTNEYITVRVFKSKSKKKHFVGEIKSKKISVG